MLKLLLFLLGLPLLQPPSEAKKKADEPTTLSATIRMRDLDLSELFAKLKENETLKLDLGYAITGKVTVIADISVPLGEATTAGSYTIRGKITSPGFKLEGLSVQELAADLVYADGKLKLTGLTAKLPPDVPTDMPGELTGTATAAVSPRGDLTANLKLARVALGQALKAVPGGLDVAGTVSGTAEFTAPVDTVTDMSKWVASADLTAPAVVAFGRSAKDVAAKVAVKDSKASLTSVSAVVEGVPVTGDGTVTLADKFAFTAAARTKPQEVSELQKLVPELELPVAVKGKLSADATVDGTLNPVAINAAGTVNATDFAIGEGAADSLSAKWKLTPERVTVTDLKAGLFKGSVSGSFNVPLVAGKAGDFKLAFKEVDAAGVAAAFPKVPVKLTGQVSGDVTGKLPAAKPGEERQTTADVNLTAPKLTVQGIPAEALTGKLALEGTAVKYELEGKTLGGSFDVKGRYPAAKQPEKQDDGEVNLRNLDLSKLAEALRLRDFPLRGVVTLSFRYSADLSNGDGTYRVQGLGFGREQFVPEIRGRLKLKDGNLELGDAVGPLSGGTVKAKVFANLSQPTRNFYRLSVDRLDLRRLLRAFAPDAEWVDGAVSLTARGKLWPEFTASGSVDLARGRVGGLTVSNLHVPYTLTVRSGGGRLAIRDAAGTVGDGRLTGQFEYSWGASGRTSGQVKFTSVRVGNVLTQLRQSNFFGTARVTGRIDVKGENVRSADDLTVDVLAALEQTAIRELPVLNTITPFVPPNALLQPFDAGELRGRLSRGVFRIQTLTLASPNADLYADGTVTTAGRLDLGVVVRTGTVGLNDALLSQLGLSIPLPIAPLPLQVIRDVSAFLSNRTVRLTVTGTAANPQPQVNTAALLTDEAIRFLLRRYLPTAAAVIPEVTPRSNR
jgi:translocation and assembly module TamB